MRNARLSSVKSAMKLQISVVSVRKVDGERVVSSALRTVQKRSVTWSVGSVNGANLAPGEKNARTIAHLAAPCPIQVMCVTNRMGIVSVILAGEVINVTRNARVNIVQDVTKMLPSALGVNLVTGVRHVNLAMRGADVGSVIQSMGGVSAHS